MKYLCSPVYTRQARRMAVEIYIRKWRRKEIAGYKAIAEKEF